MNFKKAIVVLTGILNLIISSNALATLIDNSNGLIYDTSMNITWTQDANLLGTMEGSNPNLINDIITANNGVIHDTPNYYDGTYNYYDGANGFIQSGTYKLSTNDFLVSNGIGTANWWGAQAFVGYLNYIHYDGSNSWALPTTPDYQTSNGFNKTDSQLGNLIYDGLAGVAGLPAPSGPFVNFMHSIYWSGTETISSGNAGYGWYFETQYNGQGFIYKPQQLYVLAVSNGNLTAPVPAPSTIWLFGSALAGLIRFNRKKSV